MHWHLPFSYLFQALEEGTCSPHSSVADENKSKALPVNPLGITSGKRPMSMKSMTQTTSVTMVAAGDDDADVSKVD